MPENKKSVVQWIHCRTALPRDQEVYIVQARMPQEQLMQEGGAVVVLHNVPRRLQSERLASGKRGQWGVG
jgi:hypothetical protein